MSSFFGVLFFTFFFLCNDFFFSSSASQRRDPLQEPGDSRVSVGARHPGGRGQKVRGRGQKVRGRGGEAARRPVEAARLVCRGQSSDIFGNSFFLYKCYKLFFVNNYYYMLTAGVIKP